jgi:universal stress protein A
VSASSADNKVKDSPVDLPEEPAFKRILVPTDFSESAEQALNYAVRLSKPYRAEIVVLHVFHLREYLALLSEQAQIDSATANEVLESAKRRAAHNLEEIVRRQGDKGLALIPSLRIGVPFEEIISYAAEQGIDLIVMPTHGRTGLAHFFLGSTAERVISHSGCPVLVVKTRSAAVAGNKALRP